MNAIEIFLVLVVTVMGMELFAWAANTSCTAGDGAGTVTTMNRTPDYWSAMICMRLFSA